MLASQSVAESSTALMCVRLSGSSDSRSFLLFCLQGVVVLLVAPCHGA